MQESEDEASLYPDIECLHQEMDYLHDDEGEERGKTMTRKGMSDKTGSEYALPNGDHICVVSFPKRR